MSCWYGSYVDLADKTLRELFPRLIFSVGDTDDHLRHHPPLRDGQARPEPATHAVGITRDGQL